jgi:negative regulator of sigma E activity
MNDERDSQLSAMFDGELPGAECELLARRLSRDEALRAQWSRYSMIGAAIRAERGVALDDRLALRVRSAILQEVTYGESGGEAVAGVRVAAAATRSVSSAASAERWARFARPVFGAGIAASVAVMSLVWMRGQEDPQGLLAAAPAAETISMAPDSIGALSAANDAPAAAPSFTEALATNGEPERYSTPAPSAQGTFAPPARLASYVVAHSEYSGPLSRRMALLGLVAGEGADQIVVDDASADTGAATRAGDAR